MYLMHIIACSFGWKKCRLCFGTFVNCYFETSFHFAPYLTLLPVYRTALPGVGSVLVLSCTFQLFSCSNTFNWNESVASTACLQVLPKHISCRQLVSFLHVYINSRLRIFYSSAVWISVGLFRPGVSSHFSENSVSC